MSHVNQVRSLCHFNRRCINRSGPPGHHCQRSWRHRRLET